ncbi:MAG: CapA family protein [Desulfobacteraceae bacterium]|nr:CapA family protein [Desulfobacteraceae bacterium]
MKKSSILLIPIFYIVSIACSFASEISIIGVGDIMPGTNYPSTAYLPRNDGSNLFDSARNILKDADVTFGNLEGALLNKGKSAKTCSDPSKCYIFRIPEHYVNHLKKAGFDVLSIANNHVGDFGNLGRKKTVSTLKKAGIYFAGQTTCPSALFEINKVKYGFCAFAPNRGTMDVRNIDKLGKIVRKLNSVSDIVIVSFHGGAEGAAHRYVTRKTEMFYGENRGNVYKFAHRAIDAGADIVLGHGPHVARAVELYKNRFIAYSLGNFCTYGRFSLRGPNGIAPIIKVHLDHSGKFKTGRIYSFKQEKGKGPEPDPANRAVKEIRKLTAHDFPKTNLIIQDNGRILRKDRK